MSSGFGSEQRQADAHEIAWFDDSAHRRRTVREMVQRRRNHRAHLTKFRDLPIGERVARIAGICEVRVERFNAQARCRSNLLDRARQFALSHAHASHAAVEFQVNRDVALARHPANALQLFWAHDADRDSMIERNANVSFLQRPENQERKFDRGIAQLDRFFEQRGGDHRDAIAATSLRQLDGAVPIRIRLEHGDQTRAVGQTRNDRIDVAGEGCKVDFRPRGPEIRRCRQEYSGR